MIDFVAIGQCQVVHTRDKAALLRVTDTGVDHWIPYSVMATPTAAMCTVDRMIDRVRVERWFAEKEEIEHE
jgi:hypothetical protein